MLVLQEALKMKRVVLFRGILIDIGLVKNLKLQRVLQDRKKDFLFNYSDSKQQNNHAESGGRYHEHTDEHKETYGDYSERKNHTDVTKKEGTDRHVDYTDHNESPHKDHEDYNDYREVHSEYDNAWYTDSGS
jgi:hypothetical protein